MTAAENLAQALYRHRTLHTYYNEGVAYAWVKQDPEDPNKRYLLVDRLPPHFYRVKQSLGMDLSIWRDTGPWGISHITMIYHGSRGKTIYRANMSTWRLAGFPILEHRNFTDQMQLPVKAMEVLQQPEGEE